MNIISLLTLKYLGFLCIVWSKIMALRAVKNTPFVVLCSWFGYGTFTLY